MDAVLQAKYDIKNPDEVEQWLHDYPAISALLDEAYNVIHQIFGEVKRLEVSVRHDPELKEFDAVWCDIYTDLPADEALERMSQFDRSWYMKVFRRADGKLNFNLAQ
ncbi:MAG: hypothetical protein KF716_26045 [Anaerolineae bacterium]|nr:hypothetical protein [Anaerolineae bacterium]